MEGTVFRDARLKISRANKHISDIDSIILSLPDRCVGSVEINPETGGQSIKHECQGIDAILIELSLIAGDAIHNLRAALDYAWFEVIQHIGLSTTRYTKFPFVESAKALERALIEKKIDTAKPALFKCMISQVKSYPGGNDLLYALHKLDISDKHTLPLVLVNYGGIEGIRIEDEGGIVHDAGTWSSVIASGPTYVDFHPNIKVKDKGKLTMAIILDKALALSGVDISEEFAMLSALVRHHLQLIENVVI
jgi:hypothetical protein